MRSRDVGFAVAGLLLGAVLGVLAAGSGLLNLAGTAAVNPVVRQAYYSLGVVEAQNLLTESFPEEADPLLAALTNVAGLPLADDFAAAFAEAEADVNLITERAFQAMTGLTPDPMLAPTPAVAPEGLVPSLADGPVKTCLGVDSNPYSADGPRVYLAVDVPETQVSSLPEAWEAYRLDVSKEGELFWLMLACRQVDAGSTERSR